MIESALLWPVAVLLDRRFGEPGRWHPLVGLGRVIQWAEQKAYTEDDSPPTQRMAGALALVAICLMAVFLLWLLMQIPGLETPLTLLVFYLAIGARSLNEHAMAVYRGLQHSLQRGRDRVQFMVSRNTAEMDERQIANATIESVLENGSDAIFAPIFWGLLLGPYGALVYRIANTFDAMWGYKTPKYRHFGWAAARFDDLLNVIPARLTALSYATMGSNFSRAMRCWRAQAPYTASPNGGPVMAAGAGAIGVCVGGAAQYHGEWKDKTRLGCGPVARGQDIANACALVNRTLVLWCVACAALWLGAIV